MLTPCRAIEPSAPRRRQMSPARAGRGRPKDPTASVGVIGRPTGAAVTVDSTTTCKGYNIAPNHACPRTHDQLGSRLAARHAPRARTGSSRRGVDARHRRAQQLQGGAARRLLGTRTHLLADRRRHHPRDPARGDAGAGRRRVRVLRRADADRPRACARSIWRRARGRRARRTSTITATPCTSTQGAPAHIHIGAWTLARRPLIVGAVHGLAGSGALTALVLTTLPSTAARLTYMVVFGLGSTLGMAALSGLLGWPLARAGRNRGLARALSLAVGCVSTVLGLVWGYPLLGDSSRSSSDSSSVQFRILSSSLHRHRPRHRRRLRRIADAVVARLIVHRSRRRSRSNPAFADLSSVTSCVSRNGF